MIFLDSRARFWKTPALWRLGIFEADCPRVCQRRLTGRQFAFPGCHGRVPGRGVYLELRRLTARAGSRCLVV